MGETWLHRRWLGRRDECGLRRSFHAQPPLKTQPTHLVRSLLGHSEEKEHQWLWSGGAAGVRRIVCCWHGPVGRRCFCGIDSLLRVTSSPSHEALIPSFHALPGMADTAHRKKEVTLPSLFLHTHTPVAPQRRSMATVLNGQAPVWWHCPAARCWLFCGGMRGSLA